MYRVSLSLLVAGLMVVPALGQPLEWQDDFATAATYNSASLLAPFYGGPLTKYTELEGANGDIFNTRSVVGGGMMINANKGVLPIFTGVGAKFDLTMLGTVGLGVGYPGEPAPFTSNAPFTSPNVCIYVATQWNSYQLGFGNNGLKGQNNFGVDLMPGVAGVDDNCDGTTDGGIGIPGVDDDGNGTIDEPLEVPDFAESPQSANSAYAPPATLTDGGSVACLNAPSDGAPGIAGVDDDGDGVTDEQDELGLGNDSDDQGGRLFASMLMKLELTSSSGIWANIDPGSGGGNLFSLRELVNLVEASVASSNEIVGGFYQADTTYNLAYCVSGTCYGAVLWTEANMGNPNETLGPVVNTAHTTPTSNVVAFADTSGDQSFRIASKWKGNKNFGSTFWVTSGLTSTADFGGGIFGYPSPSADLDNDRDVDATDFLTFSNCFNGSLNPPKGICASLDSDLDGDGDVDASDFLTFSNCFAGSLVKPGAACFPPNLTACP